MLINAEKCRLVANTERTRCVVKSHEQNVQNDNIKIKIYRTIIVTVVLYGCEIWTLILRKV
jgi:hypothetical protein